ncbi:hypothetical protein WICMUC_003892 [Wickerhamomyces mucosus]|uniref:PSP1 C-terminal domain-containing protein n=1 Tax=Wickerhamomyces mucosus TaxID=1378264 RepID=A0A9P8PKG7_9ASCO|nr:hypothetical protein WICMUC_003892 [Wickerhamomyces mucosus]
MFSVNTTPFNQNMFAPNDNPPGTGANTGTLGTVGQNSNLNNASSTRRSSLLESIISPTTHNAELSSIMTHSSPFNTDDPFELNTSIWSDSNKTQLPLQHQQSSSSSSSNSFPRPPSKSTSPIPAVQQQSSNYQHYNYNLSAQPGTASTAPQYQLYNRRASLPQSAPLNSNSNIWNAQNISSYNYQRFHSLDNTTFDDQNHNQQYWQPLSQQNLNTLSQTLTPGLQQQQQQQQHQQQQQQQHQQHQQQQNTRRGSLDSNGGFVNDYQGIEQQQHLNYEITKADQAMKNAYKLIDHYFTFDQYNRIAIKSYSEEHLSKIFEDLINSGAQLPRFSGNQFTSSRLLLVAFKAGRIDVFYKPDTSNLEIDEGDLVIVEADRGCDLGKIIRLNVSLDEARLLKYLQHQEQQAALASFDNNTNPPVSSSSQQTNLNTNLPTLHFPKPILRLALANEAYQLSNKNSDEEKAKKICSLKVNSLNLSMCVIDAEYQSDRRKLTFYYNAAHRIDFRDLVRDLFRIYKTRIWMCAVNSDISPEGLLKSNVNNQVNNLDSNQFSGWTSRNQRNSDVGMGSDFIPRHF